MMGAYFALTAATEVCASLEEQRRWIMLIVGGLILAAGAIIGFLWRHQRAAFYREKYRAEHALQTSEQRYRTIFENAQVIIYTLDLTGRFSSLNPAFERVTGGKCADWLGRSFAEIVHPDDLPLAVSTFEMALRGETPAPYELRILARSGKISLSSSRKYRCPSIQTYFE
jgi:PAS domain S-box-containing protein